MLLETLNKQNNEEMTVLDIAVVKKLGNTFMLVKDFIDNVLMGSSSSKYNVPSYEIKIKEK